MKKCPYCEFELDKKPTRKKKCPNCSEFIFVRRGDLYSEKQAKDYDLKSKWLSWLDRFGASEEMFTQKRKDLSKQFGFEASVNDTIWGLMMILSGKQEDLVDVEHLYLLMGDFVEEEGKDPKPYVKQAMTLMENRIRLEVRGMYKLSVCTRNDEFVCDSCKQASKRIFARDEFLEMMPIPTGCTSPRGCRCWVALEFD